MFNGANIFAAPAYPLEIVFDPNRRRRHLCRRFYGLSVKYRNISESAIRQAIIFGSVMASYNVEAFSLERLKSLNYKDIEERYRAFKKLTHFEDL